MGRTRLIWGYPRHGSSPSGLRALGSQWEQPPGHQRIPATVHTQIRAPIACGARREGKVRRQAQPCYRANFESFPASPERLG
jgi:hypothetical protein